MNMKIISKNHKLYYVSNLDTKNFNKYDNIELQRFIKIIHNLIVTYNCSVKG